MSSAEILIIGAGPAGYAFARALGTMRDVTVIAATPAGRSSGKDVSRNARSPKLRQPAVAGNVSAWRATAPSRIAQDPSFSYIGLHGWGGAAQHWGASVGIFQSDAIARNGFEPAEFEAAYSQCATYVPIAGNEDDALRSRYRPIPVSASPPRSTRISRLDGRHCGGRFVVGAPRVAVHTSGDSSCTGCNRCLAGCPHGSIWHPQASGF